MLNIFLINSYLVYLVARLVIDKENYPREQCIFIFLRGIQPLDPSKYIPYELKCRVVENNFPEFPNYLKFYKGRRLKSDLFKQIRTLTSGKNFKLHTFQTISRVVQLIRSMQECIETAILEEGSGVYKLSALDLANMYKFKINWRQKFINYLNYDLAIKNPGFIEEGLHCYCLFEEAFHGTDKKTILFNLEKIHEILSPKIPIANNSVIFLHTWFDERKLSLELSNLYAAMVFQLSKNYNPANFYQKFHPAQNIALIESVKKKFKRNGLEINELPHREPVEKYIFSEYPLTLVGWNSSALYYARRMGKNIVVASE